MNSEMTSNETPNTPTPWHIIVDVPEIETKIGRMVSIFAGEERREHVVCNSCTPEDAKLVVRAVNSHEALVDALEELLAADQAYCDAIDAGGHEGAHANRLLKARQMARTALASLEGKR